MSPRGARRLALVALQVAAVSLALGCGQQDPEPPPAAGPGAPGAPALLELGLRPGEVLVEGAASPRSHGPYRLAGRYLVRFAQYAPEAPGRGFSDQTPFVAQLTLAANPRAKPIQLFRAAAKRGSRTMSVDGRYRVEVVFGDFPYVIRFTPLG